MCGRYLRRSDKQHIAERFRLGTLPEGFLMPPDFNIAPSTFQPVIRNNLYTGEREIMLMRWGLIPFFAKSGDAAGGYKTINAKAENVLTGPTWREAFKKRRCLVPSDGFYEWKKTNVTINGKPKVVKQPYVFMPKTRQPFAFAGLWDAWKDLKTGEYLQTFAIITTTPNEVTAKVHDRMPVILHPNKYDLWLDRGTGGDPDQQRQLQALLRPYESDLMLAELANPAVGNVRNNGPEMLYPRGPEPALPVPSEEINSK